MREIILDTETTGLDPKLGHRIIEIGLLEVKNKVLTGEKFHVYINPQREVSIDAYKVHGISNEFLADKPIFSEIAEEFLDFIRDAKLVIHNAAFDMKFINHELSLLGKASIDNNLVTDTLAIARKMFPGAKVNLNALCKKFKIDNSARKFHGALLDAELLYEVYIELAGGRQNSFMIMNQQMSVEARHIDATSYDKSVAIILPTKEELTMHSMLMERVRG